MKKALYAAGIFFLLFFFLRHPAAALTASREGMSLWLNTLIPTLLPFLILTGVLIRIDAVNRLLLPSKGIWRFFFGISPAGAYALLLGLLCGYPMGAKTSSDLYRRQQIGRREAQYLLTFTNHASPAFLGNYLVHSCLEDRVSAAEVYGILLLSGYLTMLFFRFLIFKEDANVNTAPDSASKKEAPYNAPARGLLDASIMDGFETIARLGGYILLFSLLSACLGNYLSLQNISGCFLSGALELTTGLSRLSAAALPFRIKYILAISLTAFGGCCISAQTRSLVHRDLSLLPYIAAKVIHAATAAALTAMISSAVV